MVFVLYLSHLLNFRCWVTGWMLTGYCVYFCKFFKDLLVRKKRLVVLFSHWLLHAYGIISISKLDKLEQDLPLLALVPAPALFYLMTAKYTEPSRILSEGGNGH